MKNNFFWLTARVSYWGIFPLAFIISVTGCDNSEVKVLPGYAYGEFIYLSAIETAKVDSLLVNKGDFVVAGQELVKMDSFSVANAYLLAGKNYQAETALLHNLQTGGRPDELNVVRAKLEQARSAASLAKSQLERYQKLYSLNGVSSADLQSIKEEYAQKRAQVDELTHQLKANELPAREAEINRQTAVVESARLQQDKASWDLSQSTLIAPEAGQVYDIIYRRGERPLAGKPIISLLPKGNVKVRFYIPENKLSVFKTGTKVRILLDGNNAFIPGAVNYISPQAEYTPPVIYSTNRREKLIYMAEALPDKEKAEMIKPGQPVKVEIISDEPVLY